MSNKTSKVTIKDIAREAGVSVAPVSYVINNRTDLRISEETRRKVLQVINLLNYSPNQAAQALAGKKKQVYAFSYFRSDSPMKKANQLQTLEYLTEYFRKRDCECIILNSDQPDKCDQADAIICYDVPSEYFYRLGDCNSIPLIALDCFINDSLFFQINNDPERLKREAAEFFRGESYLFVAFGTKNHEKEMFLRRNFKDLFFINEADALSDITEENILTTDPVIAEILGRDHNVLLLPSVTEEKADLLLRCIQLAYDRDDSISQHDLYL